MMSTYEYLDDLIARASQSDLVESKEGKVNLVIGGFISELVNKNLITHQEGFSLISKIKDIA